MRIIDSHTAGEPTRTIIDGGPSLGDGALAERAQRFERDHESIRSVLLGEPRGHDAMVGALLCEPSKLDCTAGVIFFNTVGNLGMCGHAAMGTAVTLAHMGRISPGVHRIETPVGIVKVDLRTANEAAVENVESRRITKAVSIEVEGLGVVTGDVAWGGNWFFLTDDAPCHLTYENIPTLTSAASAIRQALVAQNMTGKDGAEIDHIEFFGPPVSNNTDSRNFVLCPGGAYDRSPCGTGTSAKLACLASDGLLDPETVWTQESIIGSTYQAHYRTGESGEIIPTIVGKAYVCAESIIYRDPEDPFANGINQAVA